MKKVTLCPIVTTLFTIIIFLLLFYFTEVEQKIIFLTSGVLGGIVAIPLARDMTVATAVVSINIAAVAIAATITGNAPQMIVVIAGLMIAIGGSAAYDQPEKEKKRFYFFLVLEALVIIATIIKIVPKNIT